MQFCLDYVLASSQDSGLIASDTSRGNYYATQAMFLAGGKYWSTFYPTIRDELIRAQQNDHWSAEVNDHYSTAMALIILQMPNRYLPVFAGKGPGS